MKTRYIILLTAFAATVAAAAPLMSQEVRDRGGMLRTLPHGTYQCSLPGDADGDAYAVVEAEEFAIGTASSYSSAAGGGTYILRGDDLTFTRGPKKGQQFRRTGTNQVQRVNKDGEMGKLICTRISGSR